MSGRGSSLCRSAKNAFGSIENNDTVRLAGELGPSTIVGSAAFNLLVITGVCIMAIDTPEIRRINYIKVKRAGGIRRVNYIKVRRTGG